jgi:hypothetical protein
MAGFGTRRHVVYAAELGRYRNDRFRHLVTRVWRSNCDNIAIGSIGSRDRGETPLPASSSIAPLSQRSVGTSGRGRMAVLSVKITPTEMSFGFPGWFGVDGDETNR